MKQVLVLMPLDPAIPVSGAVALMGDGQGISGIYLPEDTPATVDQLVAALTANVSTFNGERISFSQIDNCLAIMAVVNDSTFTWFIGPQDGNPTPDEAKNGVASVYILVENWVSPTAGYVPEELVANRVFQGAVAGAALSSVFFGQTVRRGGGY